MPETDSPGSRGADPDIYCTYIYTMDRHVHYISLSATYISLLEFTKTF